MDVHPDATLPAAARTLLGLPRTDAAHGDRSETAAQLRARLLKMIMEQERARGRSSSDPPKPR
jgi:hypothetical protein